MDKELVVEVLHSIYTVLDKLDDRTKDLDIEHKGRIRKIEEELSSIKLFVDNWNEILK